MINRQEVFHTVKDHLLKQMIQSTNKDSGMCCYRSPKGKKCAIGCLIPDELYESEWDSGVRNGGEVLLDICRAVFPDFEKSEDLDFIKSLQQIHDTMAPSSWSYTLDMFAATYGLQS